jgi:hypothetical protein
MNTILILTLAGWMLNQPKPLTLAWDATSGADYYLVYRLREVPPDDDVWDVVAVSAEPKAKVVPWPDRRTRFYVTSVHDRPVVVVDFETLKTMDSHGKRYVRESSPSRVIEYNPPDNQLNIWVDTLSK